MKKFMSAALLLLVALFGVLQIRPTFGRLWRRSPQVRAHQIGVVDLRGSPQVRAQDESVSDVVAYRQLFLAVSRQTQASVSHLHFVNLPAADQSKFEADVKEFRKRFDALVESYNTKAEAGLATEDEFWGPADALTYSTMEKLATDLSVLGAKKLNSVIQRYKENIKPAATVSMNHDHGSMLKPASFHPNALPQGCQPGNNYTTTWTYSIDTTNFYLSTIVSGTGSMPPYCPHGNWLHSPTAYATINGHQVQIPGGSGCPACYISAEADNSQPISALPPNDFQAEIEGDIRCTLAGLFYNLIQLLHFQIHFAFTTSQINWNTRGWNGSHYFWDAAAACPTVTPPDTPPDFPGPDVIFDNDAYDKNGYARVGDQCIRWAYWGNPFTGQTWFCWNVPRNDYTGYFTWEAGNANGNVCDMVDNGYNPWY